MPINTYDALRTTVVGTATPSVTFDLSSVSGYTDLIVIVSARSVFSATQVAGFVRVGNGSIDTGSNYSRTRLLGNGSTATSARGTNLTAISWDSIPGATSAAGTFGTTIIQIMNYSNTTTNKTILIRSNDTNNFLAATVGLWRSTSAINQVEIYGDGGANLAVGTTISLYGIANAPALTAKATGGTIFFGADGYVYHRFTGSSTFVPSSNISADCLVVAGGGGGGAGAVGGGGGAGGLRGLFAQPLTSGTTYTVTVGAAGVAGIWSGDQNGGNGGPSSIAGTGLTTITAAGGGGGGSGDITRNGNSGGSGGGGNYIQGLGGAGNTPATTPPQGNNGSSAPANTNFGGGGGGAGEAASVQNAGNGSPNYSAWGSATSSGQNVNGVLWYAGGGGGGVRNSAGIPVGVGGNGGGGAGSKTSLAVAGTANTGGGGGGTGWETNNTTNGVAGGSGIVIIRYLG
jgi:hypothetical protein